MGSILRCVDSDSYKWSHYNQYPHNTDYVYSHLMSRGGEFDVTVFFGLQYILKKYLSTPITMSDISVAEEICTRHRVPFNREGWLHILEKHEGRLPLRIKAVPEGSVIPIKNVLMTIENTDRKCFWLTNFIETILLRVWYTTTVATKSYKIKQLIKKYMEQTCDNLDGLPFKLHDFGSRGVSCQEQAGIGGLAHLVNFLGSDTMATIPYAMDYYYEFNPSFSIAATEHSTMTSWGKENEAVAYSNTLDVYKGHMVSVVSDSYDIYNACENIWGEELREKVQNHGNLVIIRPDSGDPVLTPVKCVEILGNKFGYTVNTKGYKVLNNVRVIQGDGIDIEDVGRILRILREKGWSADNIAFGMGGGLLQKVNRDTQKFAIKCSSITIGGVEQDVYKDPVGQSDKKSMRGRLELVFNPLINNYETRKVGGICPLNVVSRDLLETVFENGKIVKEYTLGEIRKRSESTYADNDC